MNLKFLETFVWVARLKSFRLTADKLFTTQASISSRIAVLESELGVKLFLRDSRGVSLTPEGLKVLDYAEQMMDTMQALKQSIETRSSKAGRVRIGVMDTVIHTWLSPLVAQMTDHYPLVEIELVADTSLNLCDQLQKGFLDLILQTDLVRQESVRSLELASHPHGLDRRQQFDLQPRLRRPRRTGAGADHHLLEKLTSASGSSGADAGQWRDGATTELCEFGVGDHPVAA